MTATEKLLPCPFCGRPAKVDSWWSDEEECGVAFARCTKESYVNGPECAQIWVMRADARTARRDAIAAWNRRADRGTCHDTALECEWFECSECGTVRQLIHPHYCPNCGRKVVE